MATADTANVFVREIIFKSGKDEEAERVLDILDSMGKVLATNEREGRKSIVACFDDGLDFLAFLCGIGAASYEIISKDTPTGSGPRENE